MNRARLRPAYTEDELAKLYATPHDHYRWTDHVLRVDVTIRMAQVAAGAVQTAADLSCGNGAILQALDAQVRYFGDVAPGYDITGPIEQTIDQIPPVDMFVCCETLEHLDDPGPVLRAIRFKTRALTLSTPVGAFADRNPEHYWAWDREAVEHMAGMAGFTPHLYAEVDTRPAGGDYAFGIWVLK